jgi:hypothetical protein
MVGGAGRETSTLVLDVVERPLASVMVTRKP